VYEYLVVISYPTIRLGKIQNLAMIF